METQRHGEAQKRGRESAALWQEARLRFRPARGRQILLQKGLVRMVWGTEVFEKFGDSEFAPDGLSEKPPLGSEAFHPVEDADVF